jgi:hypothetical protein
LKISINFNSHIGLKENNSGLASSGAQFCKYNQLIIKNKLKLQIRNIILEEEKSMPHRFVPKAG